MFNKKVVCFLLCLFLAQAPAFCAEDQSSDQQIDGFSLAGYGEKGKKTWDLSGKSADIFENYVKLKDLTGNMYGAQENMRLSADEGSFDKANGKIHVEQNVVMTSTSGAKLTTNSLDWDRANSVINTNDVVHITREGLFARGRGAYGQPSLNLMNLEKEVLVEILPQAKPGEPVKPEDRVVITCDGPLVVDYQKKVAIFNNNVKVDRQDTQIYSDIMEMYFGKNPDAQPQKEKDPNDKNSLFMGTKIDKIIARGNVKTVRGENITYSEQATYSGTDSKLVLTGRPRLLIYSAEDFGGLMQQSQ